MKLMYLMNNYMSQHSTMINLMHKTARKPLNKGPGQKTNSGKNPD